MFDFLLVEDDLVFAQVLMHSLKKRHFQVNCVDTCAAAVAALQQQTYRAMILDLKLTGAVTLHLIPDFLKIHPSLKILMLTGYASIATAVEAMKLGAMHYLPKPADTDDILQALGLMEKTTEESLYLQDQALDWRGQQWEQLQRTVAQCKGNISEAARLLGMHRRTLQRKLKKRPLIPH